MNRKLFLIIVIIACVVIAYVANEYPLPTLAVATCSLPFLYMWLLATNSRKKPRPIDHSGKSVRDLKWELHQAHEDMYNSSTPKSHLKPYTQLIDSINVELAKRDKEFKERLMTDPLFPQHVLDNPESKKNK